MKEKVEVSIMLCRGCFNKYGESWRHNDPRRALNDVVAEVEKLLPWISLKPEFVSCFRFCPEGKIAFSFARQLTMSRSLNSAGIVEEVLSLADSLAERVKSAT